MGSPHSADDALSRRAFLGLAAPAQPPAPKAPASRAQPPKGQAPKGQPPKARPAPRRLPRRVAGVNPAAQAPYLIDPVEEWENWALRLARRVTLGLTPEEAQRARALGYDGYLEYQLDHESIDDSAVESFVATKWPNLALPGTALYQLSAGTLQQHLQEAALYRAAFSKRQLYQRMVELWSDHFNIAISKVGYLKLLDDRDVIRKHALGSFPALLKASTKSAAMLVYLDQNISRRQSPN